MALDRAGTSSLPGEVFLLEPRINEMEIVIDEHAIRLLRRGSFSDDEMRLIVAALKITNDLERIGDIAVNVAERVISLRELPDAELPEELAPMASAVRAMVSKSLGALIFRNVEMATQVLESDDVVDQYRDRIFERLLQSMTQEPTRRRPRPAVRAGHAPPGAHRRPRHQYRRGHHFLGARAGRAPRPRPGGDTPSRWRTRRRTRRRLRRIYTACHAERDAGVRHSARLIFT